LSSKYSIWSLAKGALSGQRTAAPAWADAEPKAHYDVVLVGGSGHGLATAYYLAKNHGVRREPGSVIEHYCADHLTRWIGQAVANLV
jgi:hypothetical protein